MKEDKVIKLMKEMKIYKDDGNEFPVNYELYNTFWVEAQKELLEELLIIYDKDNYEINYAIREKLERLSLENNKENNK